MNNKYCVDCKYFVSDGTGTFQKCNRPGLGNDPVTGEPQTKLASFERISYALFGMDRCGHNAKYFEPKTIVIKPKLSRFERFMEYIAGYPVSR